MSAQNQSAGRKKADAGSGDPAYNVSNASVVDRVPRRGASVVGRLPSNGAAPTGRKTITEQTRIMAEMERRLSVVGELESVVTGNLQRAARLRQSILFKLSW